MGDAIFELACRLMNALDSEASGEVRVKMGSEVLVLKYKKERPTLSLVTSSLPESPLSEGESLTSPAPISSRRQRSRKGPR